VRIASCFKGFAGTVTLRRLLNMVLLYTGYFISLLIRKPVVAGRPFSASIEPVSWCNLSCPQCPAGTRNLRRQDKEIELGRYRQIIDELYPITWYLMLYFQGEPLLHGEFISMVSYASSRRMYTVTSTNGQLIDREMAGKLVVSGLNRIIVCVDGTDQETYSEYRKGGKLDKVLAGVRYLVESRQLQRKREPCIILQFLVFRHNQHQLKEIRRLGRELGVDRVTCRSAQVYPGTGGERLLPDNEKYRRYLITGNGHLQLKRKILNRCRRLWDTVVITSDAKVVPCCFDKEGRYDLGSFKDKGFSGIWTGSEFMSYRQRVLKDRRSIDICNNCTQGLGRVISH
jgi:MoaA/NifB/PqqE/SkfB family radical SAM enzyme